MRRWLTVWFLLMLPPVVAAEPVHIVLVGDSTVTDRSGWGLGFRQFVSDGATVSNTAQGGRSSKSFRAEGHWAKALALKGDYYLIQFGHNYQPGKGPERETDPATTFTANMARYVDEVRAIGARPVLVTSLVRRNFSKTDPARIDSTLPPYVEAAKKLAAAKNVPLIDLHAGSLVFCEALGPERTAKFNFPDGAGKNDTTHLDARGSAVFGRLVVDELRRVVPALAPVLLPEPRSAKLTDREYGTAAGEKLLLDASVPAGDGPFPVAILVHGGGWSGGDKANVGSEGRGADISAWFQPLTDEKFTWFSINYRLAPTHRWPACFEDVQTAIRWVKAHAAEFKGDPARIAIFGHSAGGHLATLAGVLGEGDTCVQAVVGFAPVTDFEYELPVRKGVSLALRNLHNVPEEPTAESLAILRATAPLSHVKPGLPPFLLLHGTADKTVPFQTSVNFQARLRVAGVTCELIPRPGAPHGLLTWEKFSPDYTTQLIAWLREKLK